MKSFLLRMLYAVICFAIFWWVLPPFLAFIGFPLSGAMSLIRIIVTSLCVLYVLFGPTTKAPWE